MEIEYLNNDFKHLKSHKHIKSIFKLIFSQIFLNFTLLHDDNMYSRRKIFIISRTFFIRQNFV